MGGVSTDAIGSVGVMVTLMPARNGTCATHSRDLPNLYSKSLTNSCKAAYYPRMLTSSVSPENPSPASRGVPAAFGRWLGRLSQRRHVPTEPVDDGRDGSVASPAIAVDIPAAEGRLGQDVSPLRLVPDYYAGSVTNEELNRRPHDPAEFTEAELADTDSVATYFARRREILTRSAPEGTDKNVRYGSANRPEIGDEFAADWRELLPEGHPQRLIGPPLVIAGTPEADATLAAAHDALRAAMRTASLPPDD